MKIETPWRIWKRFILFAILFLVIITIIDRIMVNSRTEELKNQLVLDSLEENKILSNELHSLFHGVQDDFNFIEKKIKNITVLKGQGAAFQSELKSMIEFLETHSGYFKLRLIKSDGQELFKIIQKPDRTGFYQSQELFNLADQPFYQELNQVKGEEFYFSSMEPNIINGKIETPLRPTIRVSKRIEYKDGHKGLLVFNIDGERVLRLFADADDGQTELTQKALIDSSGFYVASIPRLTLEDYTLRKYSLEQASPKLLKKLKKKKSDQGSIEDLNHEMIVYTHINLPFTHERWFLITRLSEMTWQNLVFKERLTWIFWEVLCLVLVLGWVWRDENKRHKDEVVQVLLKERGEFIQNVSHQLKTPLAILTNTLESKKRTEEEWLDLKKEVLHLTRVVEDMLLLVQVDALEHLPLKREDMIELVSGAVEKAGAKALEVGVQIRFNVDNELLEAHHRLELPVMGELLKSAILNLIDNALEFSTFGGRVDVSVSKQEDKFVIQVRDFGPGVTLDFIPKLFERFSRGNKQRKGTGLGLAITKKIVELHGGNIRLADNSHGALFEIRL